MRKIWNFGILLLLLCALTLTAYASDFLIPVGQVVGLQLQNGTVIVTELTDPSPAKEAGLQPGDCIAALDGKPVTSAAQLKDYLKNCGNTVQLQVFREGKELAITVHPAEDPQGHRLGVYLKEGVTGIGTITYYDPETGTFGTLGHGVNNPSGSLITMESGLAYPARVQSVRPGKTGAPGQLVGAIRDAGSLGKLYRNTPQGLFGRSSRPFSGQALETMDAQDVKPGPATILSTISGSEPQEYSVEILKIYAKDRPNGRNMLIQVTDPRLLETTGGIVQGMSGSPILQNGRIVGAVTHVLVNDPTTGYGIFIENMLDAAA